MNEKNQRTYAVAGLWMPSSWTRAIYARQHRRDKQCEKLKEKSDKSHDSLKRREIVQLGQSTPCARAECRA